MTNRFTKNILIFSLSVFLVFQVNSATGQSQPPSSPVVLKAVTFPFLSFAPIFIAQEEGYFTEQGVQIEFIKMKEEFAFQALAKGEVDVWSGLVSIGALNAMHRGAIIRFVAERGSFAADGCPYFGLVARKALVESEALTSPGQLKGRNVAWYRASFEEYFLEKVLKQDGVVLGDLKKITIPVPADLGAMAKGTLDLTVTSEPWVRRLEQGGHGVLWVTAQEVIPGFQFGTTMYGPYLIEKNPDAGNRFMVAYLKGIRQYNRGKTARNLQILAKHTRLKEDLLKQACWSQVNNDGRVNVQSIDAFQNWAKGKGYLDDLVLQEKFMDSRFVDYANKFLAETQ